MPVIEYTSFPVVITSIGPIPIPSSSIVSRLAASIAVSFESICPPGKDTCPLCVPTCCVLTVNNIDAFPW